MVPRETSRPFCIYFIYVKRVGSFLNPHSSFTSQQGEGLMHNFLSLFKYTPDCTLMLGVERECFLTQNGSIVPISPQVLPLLPNDGHFGFELSACQLEERIGPCHLLDVPAAFLANEKETIEAERSLGFSRLYCEVAPDDMPLDVFPDPTGRYQKITKNMPKEVLLSACQVAATHIHVGMPDHHTALEVYNKVITHLDQLCLWGDHSNGRRLEIYRNMAPDYLPLPYASWEAFHEEAMIKGFVNDPRKCWHLIRLSIHGTIEFRMFGTTDDKNQILAWAGYCREVCRLAMSR